MSGLDRKRHVAVVGHRADDRLYGAERSLLDILAAVDRGTYELSCVLPRANHEYARAVAGHGADVSVFPYEWWNRGRPPDEQAVARFETLFRDRRVDLVHVNTITLMEPLLAARRLDVPSVVHAREIITEDPHLAKLLGDDPESIIRTVQATADFIIANSEATHSLYRKEERSFRLYNGIDVDRFDLPNELDAGPLRVGIISSNEPHKGIEHFVRLATLASRYRREMQFVIIGPRTPHLLAFEAAVRRGEGPVNLRLVDYVADPVDAVRQVNVVVSLSLVAESFGRTIVEAMAARRPVVGYRSGALPEIVRDCLDGFLIAPLDVASALNHLGVLADDPERVVTMGCSARRRAKALFSRAVFGSRLNEIYGHILEQWTRRTAVGIPR